MNRSIRDILILAYRKVARSMRIVEPCDENDTEVQSKQLRTLLHFNHHMELRPCCEIGGGRGSRVFPSTILTLKSLLFNISRRMSLEYNNIGKKET